MFLCSMGKTRLGEIVSPVLHLQYCRMMIGREVYLLSRRPTSGWSGEGNSDLTAVLQPCLILANRRSQKVEKETERERKSYFLLQEIILKVQA